MASWHYVAEKAVVYALVYHSSMQNASVVLFLLFSLDSLAVPCSLTPNFFFHRYLIAVFMLLFIRDHLLTHYAKFTIMPILSLRLEGPNGHVGIDLGNVYCLVEHFKMNIQ